MDTSRFLRGIREGDPGAFDILLSEEALRAHTVAYHITGDGRLAEAVVRKAFLQIREGRTTFQEGEGKAEITRLVARMSVDAAKERAGSPPHENGKPAPPEAGDGPVPEGPLPPEVAQAVSEGIRTLPADVRAAIWLHLVEGDRLDDVAAALGSDRSTVSHQVRNGLDALRLAVEGQGFSLNAMPLRKLLRQLPVPAPSQEFLSGLGGPGFKPPEPRRAETPIAPRLVPVEEEPAPVAPPPPARVSRRLSLALAAVVFTVFCIIGVSLWLSGAFALGRGGRPVTTGKSSASGTATGSGSTVPPEVKVSNGRPGAARAYRVEGRVLDHQGRPASGAEVTAYRDLPRLELREALQRWIFVDFLKENQKGLRSLGSTRSDENGRFSLSLEGAPNVLLQAFSMDRASGRGGTARTYAGATAKPEIVLVPWTELNGVVRDGEKPLASAQVLAIPDPNPSRDREFDANDLQRLLLRFVPANAVTDPAGRFRLFQPGGDQLTGLLLIAFGEGYAAGYAPWKPPPAENVLRLVRAVEVSGQAFAPGDVPAVGARILARSVGEDGSGWFAAAISDDSGRFTLEGSTGGEFRVHAKMVERLQPETMNWRNGDPLQLRVDFGGGTAIHGRVRLARTGQPVEGVRILCRDAEAGLVTTQTASDGEGRYRLRGLPESSNYDLLVLIPGYVSRKQVERPAEKTDAEFDIELVPTATVRGRAVGTEGGVPNAPVEVIVVADSDREAIGLRWRRELMGQGHGETDADGNFAIEDIDARGKVFLWCYDNNQGECFTGPLQFSGEDLPKAEVTLQFPSTSLEVVVSDSKGQAVYGVDVELLSKVISDQLPPGMGWLQWFNQRTSVDVSWFSQQFSLTPGTRKCQTREDTQCLWPDLIASGYRVSVSRQLSGESLPEFYKDSQVLMGFLEEPLKPKKTSDLKIVLNQDQRLVGRVEDAAGRGLPNLRIQISYSLKLPGLKEAQGYTVTHSGEEGAFQADGLGPGPYRVIASDEEGHRVEVSGVPQGTADLKIAWKPGDKAGSSR